MSDEYRPYDADRPLLMRCACGQHASDAEHERMTAAASESAKTRERERQRFEAELSDARLPPRLRMVVTLYYFEDLSLKEIGRVLGVTESRICQLHTKAVLHLRTKLADIA